MCITDYLFVCPDLVHGGVRLSSLVASRLCAKYLYMESLEMLG